MKPLFTQIDLLVPLLERGFVVLTPNRRLSRAVRDSEHRWRAARGDQVWSSSSILPLREYWKGQWNQAVTRGELQPALLLDAQAQKMLWQKVIEADTREFSLLSAGRAAALCQEGAERLALWQLDPDSPALAQEFDFGADTGAFRRWHAQFQLELKNLEACTPEQALQELLGKPELLTDNLALLEIEELPPLHEQLCNASASVHRLKPRARRAKVQPTLAYADPQAELQAAARWCHDRAEADPEGRYAVVLSDMPGQRDRIEYLLRREFGCLTANYESLPVNFSTGFALARTPLVRDALRILRLSAEQVDIDDAIGLLQSRFIRPLEFSPEHLEARISSLTELMQTRIPQRVLRAQLDGVLLAGQAEAPWNRLVALASQGRWHRRERYLSEWQPAFRAILEAWGWSQGLALDSLEFQQLTQWQEVLDSLASLDPLSGPLNFQTAVFTLSLRLAEAQFQPRTEDRGIQVLGPLETTGLSFDGIWLTSMNSVHWPPTARPNPYLPYSLQREHRMPHVDAAWEWERAQSRWSDWAAGGAELRASYVNQADGATVPASPLIADIEEQVMDAPYEVDARWADRAVKATGDTLIEAVTLGAPALGAQERAASGVGTQVIEQQSNCPFQAFAAARLRAGPASAACMGLSPAERGAMLHAALYELFGLLGSGNALTSADASARDSAVSAAVAASSSSLRRERRDILGASPVALEQTRLHSLLHSWLAVESDRTLDFQVAERETPRKLSLAGLELRLRIDRVDHLPDGQSLVIDYKSGVGDSIERWREERSTRPQLPLYALLGEPVPGIAFASLKPGNMGFRGVGAQSFAAGIVPADQWSHLESAGENGEIEVSGSTAMTALRDFWRRNLESLADEFVRGESRVTPSTPGACRYCQRFALCRLQDGLDDPLEDTLE